MALFDKLKDKKKEDEKKTSGKGGIKVAPAKAPAGLVVQEEPVAPKKAAAKTQSKPAAKKATTTASKTVTATTAKAPAKTATAKTTTKSAATTKSTAKATSATAKTTAKTGVTKAPEAKATPAKATAKKAPAKAAKPAAKATATKAATAKKSAAPAEDALSSIPVYYAPANPFHQTTEEDIQVAFDHAIGEAEKEILRNGSKAIGKYEFTLEVDGYHFCLIANNGQTLFESPSFTSMLGALNGLNTFKRTVAATEFDIKVDKYNRYRFILANKYYGENYTTREQCQKAAESVRNFANNAHIIRFTPSKEELRAFETAKITKKTEKDIDWNAIARAEAAAAKKGKFEICREKDEYCFYLLASNGQILYSSRFYANESACRRGIESFKRAAYVGNFFVDRDKFGHYRYVLKNIGSAPAFIGESYDNKPQCENIIQSVKNFIVTASIELDPDSIG